jgi:hypothetical protein
MIIAHNGRQMAINISIYSYQKNNNYENQSTTLGTFHGAARCGRERMGADLLLERHRQWQFDWQLGYQY